MVTLDANRRKFLMSALLGAGGIGLRSLATGLPISFLLGKPTAARAAAVGARAPQYLIFSTSGDGDPITCNVPGTYVNGVDHSAHPAMVPTALNVGGSATTAALPWARFIPSVPGVTDRINFFHHATLTVDHSAEGQVMRLLGATTGGDMVQSIFAAAMATQLGTIQSAPVQFCAYPQELATYQGRTLSSLSPQSLRAVLAPPTGPLGQLVALRDKQLDAMNTYLKQAGTPAQRQALDMLALSQTQARSISDDLLGRLAAIQDDSNASQLMAALTLIQMKVTPVVQVHLHLGGDSHNDTDQGEVFAGERRTTCGLLGGDPMTNQGVGDLTQLFQNVQSVGLQNQVTFASYNVFGRGLKQSGSGREHSFTHNCGILIGANVRAGITGGIVPTPDGSQFQATPINSTDGTAAPNGGDIPYVETMAAFGKTFGAAVGLSDDQINSAIRTGRIVQSAVI